MNRTQGVAETTDQTSRIRITQGNKTLDRQSDAGTEEKCDQTKIES